MSRNQSETGLSDTRAETIQKRELPDPRIYGPLVQQLLHAVRLSASRAANSAPLVQLTAARIDHGQTGQERRSGRDGAFSRG